MENNQYRYTIKLEYMYDKQLVIIETAQIHSLIIDYDYDKRNMPIMFLKASIGKNVLDHMIKNSSTNNITVIVSKFIYNMTPKIEQAYIRDRFIYFLPKDMNVDKDLDYNNYTKDAEDIYKTVTIGLMKLDNINNNKILVNDVFINTTISNMLLKYLSHMKLLIEPISNTKTIDRFIVPPITSVTNLIKYFDDYFGLYSTPYRLFYDYDKTYLLSSSGNGIAQYGDEGYSVILNVNNTTKLESKLQGVEVDRKQKAYFIDVDSKDISMYQDEATDKNFNTIITVDGNGNYKKVKLNTENIDTTKEKTLVERVHNDNLEIANKMKRIIEDKSICVNVVKTEIDTSKITINKEYIIRNFDKLGYRNGKFLLSRKREIYTLDNDNFILSCIMTFRKILS